MDGVASLAIFPGEGWGGASLAICLGVWGSDDNTHPLAKTKRPKSPRPIPRPPPTSNKKKQNTGTNTEQQKQRGHPYKATKRNAKTRLLSVRGLCRVGRGPFSSFRFLFLLRKNERGNSTFAIKGLAFRAGRNGLRYRHSQRETQET